MINIILDSNSQRGKNLTKFSAVWQNCNKNVLPSALFAIYCKLFYNNFAYNKNIFEKKTTNNNFACEKQNLEDKHKHSLELILEQACHNFNSRTGRACRYSGTHTRKKTLCKAFTSFETMPRHLWKIIFFVLFQGAELAFGFQEVKWQTTQKPRTELGMN